jgi:hypothetical protein
MSEIKLFTGPRLERHEWVYDAANSSGEMKVENVTARAHEYVYRDIAVEPDVTLADIFALVAPNTILLAVFRQDFVEELCVEYKKGNKKPTGEPWEQLEYLELYQVWALDTATQTYQWAGRYRLHGVGGIQPADIIEHGYVMHKKDERIQWGVSLTPLRELLHLPLRVNTKVRVQEEDLDSCNFGKTLQTVINPQITLGGFIKETLWELSFHGGPDESATVWSELKSQVAELEDEGADAVEAVTYDDIFESLGFNSRNSVYNQFFDAWNPAAAHELYRVLREMPDSRPIQSGLCEALVSGAIVKTEFAGLSAREFRKLIREAQYKTS